MSHIVVCGHTSCGGCAAALGNKKLGVIDTWLSPLRRLRGELSKGWDEEGLGEGERAARLVEANVREGVRTVRENGEVVKGMRERGVEVHGVVFDVGTGELRELDCGEGEEVGKSREGAFGLE